MKIRIVCLDCHPENFADERSYTLHSMRVHRRDSLFNPGTSLKLVDISPEMFAEFLRVVWAAWTAMPQGQPETYALEKFLYAIDNPHEKVKAVIARNRGDK